MKPTLKASEDPFPVSLTRSERAQPAPLPRLRIFRFAQRARAIALPCLFFLAVLPGMALGQMNPTPVSAATVPPGRGVVVLATGTAGYWPDVSSYADRLKANGVPHAIMLPYQRNDMSQAIASAYQNGALHEPIVLLGYSQGCGECVRIARTLCDRSVPVTSLLLLEAGGPFVVPPNVRRCFNLYTSNPLTDGLPLLRGLPVHAESGSTLLVNWDAKKNLPQGSELTRQRHLALGSSIPAREMLLDFVRYEFSTSSPTVSVP